MPTSKVTIQKFLAINLCCLLPLFLGLQRPALAWGTHEQDAQKHKTSTPVHQWIGNEAWRYFSAQVQGADMAPHVGPIQGFYLHEYNTFLEGIWAQDENGVPPLNETNLPLGPFVHHLCAGADGAEFFEGWQGNRSNFQQARLLWPHAVSMYAQDKARAYYYLGQVAHLLGDLCVPAHVHNDAHHPADPDQYEAGIAFSENYKLWFYGASRSGDWSLPLTLHADLEDLFRITANYTEDYDSTSGNGDGPPYFFPEDFPRTWHLPQRVDRTDPGAITIPEVGIIGDDLMPYAMKRTAELIRFFYSVVDKTPPQVALEYPAALDEQAPEVRTSLESFRLRATAADPESGVLVEGYRFLWSRQTDQGWSPWEAVQPEEGPAAIRFTPETPGLYQFMVSAENGGGLRVESTPAYLQIEAGGGEGEGEGEAEELPLDDLRVLLYIYFDRADANADGELTLEETNDFLRDRNFLALTSPQLAPLDVDGDGALERGELGQPLGPVLGCLQLRSTLAASANEGLPLLLGALLVLLYRRSRGPGPV